MCYGYSQTISQKQDNIKKWQKEIITKYWE